MAQWKPQLKFERNRCKKMAKIQNLKFLQSLYNFGRDPPSKYARIFGSESVMCFRGDIV